MENTVNIKANGISPLDAVVSDTPTPNVVGTVLNIAKPTANSWVEKGRRTMINATRESSTELGKKSLS